MRVLLWLVPLAVVVAGVGLKLTARPTVAAPPRSEASKQGAPVTIATVTRGEIVQTLDAIGVLRAEQQVNINTKLPARVLTVLVREGDRVGTGTVLIQLDDRDYAGQVRQAQAGLRAAQATVARATQGGPLKAVEVTAQIGQAEENVRAAEALVRQAELGEKLEARQSDSDFEQAQSGVRSAEAGLAKARKGARPEEIARAESGVRQAELGMEKMQRDSTAARKLYENGGLTKRDFEDAQTGLRIAQEQVNDARAALRLARSGATVEDVALVEEELKRAKSSLDLARDTATDRKLLAHERIVAARTQVALAKKQLDLARAGQAQVALTEADLRAAQALVEQAQAGLGLAQQQVAEAKIRAPVAGVVTELNARVGEMLLPGSTLMKITNAAQVVLEATLPLRELSTVKVGQTARVAVESAPGRKFSGTVSEVLPVATSDNRSFMVKLALLPDRALTPGAFARGTIEVARHPKAVLVPRAALWSLEGRSARVFVVQGDKAVARSVRLGLLDEQRAEVVAGLNADDRVVLTGAGLLRDGDAVRVLKQ